MGKHHRSKRRERIAVIRQWQEVTGNSEIDMHAVAEFARDKLGWPVPRPPNPLDLLAKDFTRAARQDIRKDGETGAPYRGYHAVTTQHGEEKHVFWFDIEDSTRKQMSISVTQRREQMVGDGLQLVRDVDHWNSINADQDPIQVELDFTDDVEWRKNEPASESDADDENDIDD